MGKPFLLTDSTAKSNDFINFRKVINFTQNVNFKST